MSTGKSRSRPALARERSRDGLGLGLTLALALGRDERELPCLESEPEPPDPLPGEMPGPWPEMVVAARGEVSCAEATEAERDPSVDSDPSPESKPELPEFPLSGDRMVGRGIPAAVSVARLALWKSNRRWMACSSANVSCSWITRVCCATA